MELDPQIFYALLFGIIYVLGLMKGVQHLLSVRPFDIPSLEYQIAYEQSKVVQDECPICLLPLIIEDNVILTRCGHWFHDEGCLSQLNCASNRSYQECPLCRTSITKDANVEIAYFFANFFLKDNNKLMDKDSFIKPLMYLIAKGYNIKNIIQVLQSNMNWDINERFMDGSNIFLYAIRLKNLYAIRILLNKGADLNSCDYGGRNALDLAIIHHQDAIASILIEDGIRLQLPAVSYLRIAIRNGMLDTTKALLERLKNDASKMMESKDEDGQSLLHLAVKSGNYEMVLFISEQFNTAKLNVDCLDKLDQSPLLLACEAKELNNRIASILVFNLAKSDLVVNNQLSPLEYVIRNTENEDGFLTRLLSRGAKVENRLICLARESGKESYARILEDPQTLDSQVLTLERFPEDITRGESRILEDPQTLDSQVQTLERFPEDITRGESRFIEDPQTFNESMFDGRMHDY